MVFFKILATILLFILPGLLFKKNNLIEKLGLGIIFNITAGLIFAILKIFNKHTLLFYFLILTCILIYKNKKLIQLKKINKHKITYFSITIILMILTSLPVLLIHTNYTGTINYLNPKPELKNVTNEKYLLPFHGDEWSHVSQIKSIIENQKILLKDPQYKTNKTRDKLTGILQSGFHIFTAEILIILNLPVLETIWIFPFLINILAGLFIYNFLTIKKTKKHLILPITAFTILSYSIQKNTINLMGNWFYTPIALAVTFAILNLTFLAKNKNYQFIITTLGLIMIHPPVASIFIISKIIKEMLNKKINKKIILAGVFIITTVILIKIFLEIKLINFIFKYIVYNFEISVSSNAQHNLLKIIGINILLLPFGIKKLIKNKNKGILTFITLLLINYILYYFFKITFLIRIQRNIFLLITTLILINSLGILEIIQITRKLKYKNIIIAIIFSILIITTSINLTNYQKNKDQDHLYQLIRVEDYEFLKEVERIIGKENIVFTGLTQSITIFPTINNYIVGAYGTNLGSGNMTPIKNFINYNCYEKEQAIIKNKADYIWTPFEIKCRNFKKIFQQNYNRLYELEK